MAVEVVAANFDHGEFAGDDVFLAEVADFDDVDEFVELFFDLFDGCAIAVDDDGHAAEAGHFGVADGEGFDVEAAPAEEAGDAHEDAGFVFDDGDDGVVVGAFAGGVSVECGVHRASSSAGASMVSERAAPAGTMGQTFSSWSIMKSRRMGPLWARASRMAGATSALVSTRMARMP